MKPYINRFPGLQPFFKEDVSVFFGREEEVLDLKAKVSLEPVTIIFGGPGSGKSSLLNACLKNDELFANWKRYYFRALNYRGNEKTLLKAICEEIRNEQGPGAGNELLTSLQMQFPDSIWLALKNASLKTEGSPHGIVLVFDQLEELFYTSQDQVASFKNSVVEAVRGKVPVAYLDYFETHGDDLSSEDFNALTGPINVKAFFVIRSGDLFRLNDFNDVWPGILRNCLEVKDFSADQARRALIGPAAMKGDFVSPPFQISAKAIDKIIDSLKDQFGRISPYQLQLIGSTMEKTVVSRRLSVIDSQDLGSIEDTITQFFIHALDGFNDGERKQIQSLFENVLLENGLRIPVAAQVLRNRSNIPESVLGHLAETNILTRTNSAAGVVYEISHDLLVKPILEAGAQNKRENMERENKIALLEARTKAKTSLFSWFRGKK